MRSQTSTLSLCAYPMYFQLVINRIKRLSLHMNFSFVTQCLIPATNLLKNTPLLFICNARDLQFKFQTFRKAPK